MQCMILQQSVSGVPELHLLKTQLEIQGKTLDNNDRDMDYVELLLLHVLTHDKAKEKRSSSRWAAQHLLTQGFSDSDSSDNDGEESDNEEDTTYDINAAKGVAKDPQLGRLPDNKWRSIDSDTKSLWHKISPTDRSIILGNPPDETKDQLHRHHRPRE